MLQGQLSRTCSVLSANPGAVRRIEVYSNDDQDAIRKEASSTKEEVNRGHGEKTFPSLGRIHRQKSYTLRPDQGVCGSSRTVRS